MELPRGKTLRTKVKAEKALTKARLQATKEWEERTSNFSHILKKQFMKITEKLSFDDLLAIAVGSWSLSVFKKPEAFLWGAIGYKLAITRGGAPPLSQAAGLATLSSLGLLSLGLNILNAKSQEEATKSLKDMGYSDEEIELMKGAGSRVAEEFRPFG